MSKRKRKANKSNGLTIVSVAIIGIGFLFALMPHILRVYYYYNSARLAEQMADAMGNPPVTYVEIDYSKMETAVQNVYTAEEIDSAQQNTSLLDDLADIGDSTTVIDAESPAVDLGTIKENSYLLEIPAIDLKICAIRCASFERIYKDMRIGAAVFPNAPEPDEIGNICMSAHRTGSRDYFRNLDRLKKGDVVYLHCKEGSSYQYQVVSVSTIEPDDWSVTGQTLKPTVTMLSCQEYQGVSNGRRIMVRAELVGISG